MDKAGLIVIPQLIWRTVIARDGILDKDDQSIFNPAPSGVPPHYYIITTRALSGLSIERECMIQQDCEDSTNMRKAAFI